VRYVCSHDPRFRLPEPMQSARSARTSTRQPTVIAFFFPFDPFFSRNKNVQPANCWCRTERRTALGWRCGSRCSWCWRCPWVLAAARTIRVDGRMVDGPSAILNDELCFDRPTAPSPTSPPREHRQKKNRSSGDEQNILNQIPPGHPRKDQRNLP
jgi:hypothetical protein